jgi:hypothetical protein
MLVKTTITVPSDLLLIAETKSFDVMKTTLNEPTGDLFYDPWTLKQEFIGSVWEKLIEPLGPNIGEVRIIVLDSPSAYTQHADIDDRYHLNITGDGSYLLDLNDLKIYPLINDGIWYIMNAGKLHTAIAVGKKYRIQLVVRKLLTHSVLVDPINVKLTQIDPNSRYDFDNSISSWLNQAVKRSILDNFRIEGNSALFAVEHKCLHELLTIVPSTIKIYMN